MRLKDVIDYLSKITGK
jgi:hypothetical protein